MAYSRTRARDADRAAAIEVLSAAFADGQLDRAEHDVRVSKLQSARTFADLDAQLFDLQKPGEQHWRAPAGAANPAAPSAVPRQFKAVLAGLIVVAGLVIVLPQIFSSDPDPAPVDVPVSTAVAERESITDPRTAEGYAEFLGAMQAKHQTTSMTRAQLSESSVSVTLPVSPKSSRRYITWYWNGEWSEFSTGTYSDTEKVYLLNLEKVDATSFPAALELSLGRIDEPESASMSIDPNAKTCYDVYVNNRFDESYLGRFTCDGTLVEDD